MDISTIITVVIGGVLATAGGALNSWWETKRERKQSLWRIEFERILELEERAGDLMNIVCGHQTQKKQLASATSEKMERLYRDSARFYRYDSLRRAILDLYMWLNIVIVNKIEHDDWRDNVKEAQKSFTTLLDQTEKITGKRTL